MYLVKLLVAGTKVQNLKEQNKSTKTSASLPHTICICSMHPNGIAYDVIKKKIPVINSEIAKVLQIL